MALPLIYSLRSIAIRKGSSAMAVFGIALVVVVFTVLLALAEGFRRAVATAGSPRNVIVLRKGADAEMQSQVRREAGRIIAELPCVDRDTADAPLFSAESVTLVTKPRKDGSESQLNLRGISPMTLPLHQEVRLKEGRWPAPGTTEAAVGAALARRIEGFSPGGHFISGRHEFSIVGVFDADGSSFESEIWMDGEVFLTAFNRGDIFQSFTFRASGGTKEAVETLQGLALTDPRLRTLQAMGEKEYYRKQSELMAEVITVLGGMLTLIMAVGGIVGAMNTMYAAVGQRRREIGCMLALGFSPGAVWLAFIIEALALSILGAALGCALGMLFDGMKTGTTNWATFSETAFEFDVTPTILAISTALALGMGFIGGFLPAVSAARMKVVHALRRA